MILKNSGNSGQINDGDDDDDVSPLACFRLFVLPSVETAVT